MSRRESGILALLFTLVLVSLFVISDWMPLVAQEQQESGMGGDIDAFMAEVLGRREINWYQLYDYVFSEIEILEFGGMLNVPIQGFRKEYVWYVKDGYLVRSPVSVNGVPVPEEEQRKEEKRWIEDAKKGRKQELGITRDNFFGFDFKKGEFFYAGKQQFDGREVALIEYYPWGAMDEEHDAEEFEEDFEKSFFVTMLVIPEEHQIVRMTLNNMGFDFLPGRWLVRLDEIEATMTMDKPFGEIWLLKEIKAFGKVSSAYGSFMARYMKRYFNYRKAEVKVQFRFAPRSSDR